jgi:inositol phosphorylceramide synthase catalytic subunit
VIFEKMTNQESSWNRVHTYYLLGFSLFYLFWCAFVVDVRVDHLIFYLLISSMMLISKTTRNFALGFSFFSIFWIMYDGLRVLPNYIVNSVHIIQPYNLEKILFGVNIEGKVLTPNEFFSNYNFQSLDVITALFYLTWVPIPLALAFYLFLYNREMLLKFTGCYLLANLVGFIGYYSYPAAPPWYFEQYGDVLDLTVKSNAAGLLRFDKIINYPLFENLYQKNSNVFAAIPSMHSAYPVIAWYWARKQKLKWFKYIIFIDILGIWFSAIYTFHHYVIDVMFGLFVAVISIFIFEKLILKSNLSKFISNFAQIIE